MTFGIGTKKIDSIQVTGQTVNFRRLKDHNSTLNLNIADAKLIYVPKNG
jgi:hypothetical protein